MSQKHEKLKILLKELFQLDQPDLDFGIYRVLHAKSAEVSQFLDKDLLPQVRAAFDQYKTVDKGEIEQDLAKTIKQARELGVDPETTQKVTDLRARLKNDAVDIGKLESEVYDHLFNFFRHYYAEGDFLAKRVYKWGVYAIPYEGEEVMLHWANKDQYYIKTSEYLRDYAFRLMAHDEKKPMRVHFRLADGDEGEHGNIKVAVRKDRVFILAAPGLLGQNFIAEEGGEQGKELVIYFTYRPATLTDWPEDEREGKKKPPGQKDLIVLAAKCILAETDTALMKWIVELGKPHTGASGEQVEYTRIEAHLRRYTARNTFDYFIHKDLGPFLRRELDFYIKNEVMHLDDVENESAPRVEEYLSKIKVIRRIAGKIIDFLAQLEDFQKQLWLKKKFVVETQYCIAVGSISEAFYSEIAANEAQREEWVKLFAIDEIKGDMTTPGYSKNLKPEFLKTHPTLVVDLRHFDVGFTARLLEAMSDLDDLTDGVLIHGENSQALSLMQARYREKVKCIYIDPPYNTDASAILYKNDYKDSSWLSLMENRLSLSAELLSSDGIICCAIDDEEASLLRIILGTLFRREIGVAAVRSNPAGRKSSGQLSPAHEYAFFFGNAESVPGPLKKTTHELDRYPHVDAIGRYAWNNLMRHGSNDRREDRPKLFYPIFVADNDTIRVPRLRWKSVNQTYDVLEPPDVGEIALWPIRIRNDISVEKNWHRGPETIRRDLSEYRVRRKSPSGLLSANGQEINIDFKIRIDMESMPRSWWDDGQYASANLGARALKDIFGEKNFNFPKATGLVEDCLRASNVDKQSIVIDYFAGSGTTGHAVINLNREDGGRRRFVLVETGDYFDTVLVPRIKKVTCTSEWKDGKPKRLATPEEAERSPRIVKVVRLESYEDTLNNLETRRTDRQQLLLDAAEAQGADGLREQYMLRYMLDVETHGSQSLLNVQAFTDPTAYKLRIKHPGSDESREINVDLLETFNWLIGLTVRHIAVPQAFSATFERDSEKRLQLKDRLKQQEDGPYWFRTVSGMTPDGRRTLIIWRKITGDAEQDNLTLDEWFTRQGYSAKDSEFDLIYVNGGNNLENLKTPDDLWKVRLIEEDFHRLMFEIEGA